MAQTVIFLGPNSWSPPIRVLYSVYQYGVGFLFHIFSCLWLLFLKHTLGPFAKLWEVALEISKIVPFCVLTPLRGIGVRSQNSQHLWLMVGNNFRLFCYLSNVTGNFFDFHWRFVLGLGVQSIIFRFGVFLVPGGDKCTFFLIRHYYNILTNAYITSMKF